MCRECKVSSFWCGTEVQGVVTSAGQNIFLDSYFTRWEGKQMLCACFLDSDLYWVRRRCICFLVHVQLVHKNRHSDRNASTDGTKQLCE